MSNAIEKALRRGMLGLGAAPSPAAQEALAQVTKERDVFERAAAQLQRELDIMLLRAQSAEALTELRAPPMEDDPHE